MYRFLTFLLLLVSGPIAAQTGLLKESLTAKSKVLSKDVEYSLFLPADYEQSNRRYPVLYLLHGYSDDETGWTQFGEAHLIASRLMQTGEIPPMLIVMPDAGVTWYINSADGKGRYEDFFIKEFIPFIDSKYRTRSSKEFRAIAGLSMGGYGAMLMAVKHPDLFAAAAPLSAAIWTDEYFKGMEDATFDRFFGAIFGLGLKGEARLNDHWNQNSVLKYIASAPVEPLKKVRFYIDCGDDDFLIKGNMALHGAMLDRQIPHEFRVRDGGHTWTYWRTALPEVLKFVGVSFHR